MGTRDPRIMTATYTTIRKSSALQEKPVHHSSNEGGEAVLGVHGPNTEVGGEGRHRGAFLVVRKRHPGTHLPTNEGQEVNCKAKDRVIEAKHRKDRNWKDRRSHPRGMHYLKQAREKEENTK